MRNQQTYLVGKAACPFCLIQFNKFFDEFVEHHALYQAAPREKK
jgi:hypothetical protein